MADSDKNIVITPFVGATSQPRIVFTGQGNDPITVRVLDGATGTGLTAGGALSFEGSAGQLFSVVNRLGTGSIFSVNDISGIPSMDIDASGRIHMAAFTGFIGIGLTAPADKLDVLGNVRISGGLCAAGISAGSYILTSAGIKGLTGTTYTFLSTDNGDVLTHDNASGCTMTIPTGLPVGFSTTIIRLNATGRVGFTAASGVTLNIYNGFTGLAGQHAAASLISYASNIYNLSGTLA
jgi:hypothetical protein